jgi:hypothetical protein
LIGRRLSWASDGSIQQLAKISDATWRATSDPDQDVADAGSTPREILMRGRALLDRCASIWNASDAPQTKQQDLRWCLTERPSQRPRVAPQRPKGSQERRHFHFVLSHEDGKIWTRVRHSERVYDFALPQYKGPSPTQTPVTARQELGRFLFGVLFEDQKTRNELLLALDQNAASRHPLGVHLHFEHNSACLLHYPWELIHDDERFLAQNGSVEIIRRLEFPRRPSPITDLVYVSLPLPILYVAPRPTDQRGLSSFEEKVLSELPQHIGMRKVLPATHKEVERHLQDGAFHVFHFDGYGRAGDLMFEKEYTPTSAATSEPMSAVEMKTLLSKRELRVAVLSACDSATIPNPHETFSSICSSLIKAGVAGVVGMQAVINASNAASFVQRLYETFADRNNPLPLVDAVSAARRKLASSADWFVPVLYLRCGDDEGRFFVYD